MSGTDLIVLGSLALAAVFWLAWLLRPTLRRQIEAPKHEFAAQVRQYDEACRAHRERNAAADES